MLKSVHIRSFLSCTDVQITNLENICTLVGKNGAGKSNIMRAIEWAAKSATGVERAKKTEPELDAFQAITGEVALTFYVGGTLYQFEIRRDLRRDETENNFKIHVWERLSIVEPPRRLIFDRSATRVTIYDGTDGSGRTIDIGAGASALPALVTLLPENSFAENIASILLFLRGVRYYPLDCGAADDSFLMDEDYQRWQANRSKVTSDASDIIKKIFNLHSARTDEHFELLSLIGPDGLNVVENIQVYTYPPYDSDEQRPRVHLVYFGTPYATRVSFKQLSFGTQRLIHLVVSILFDRSTIALVEQPEDGIHASLVQKLAGVLREYADNCQIFFATHSATILNEMQPSEVRLVEMTNEGTKLRPLSDGEIHAAEEYLSSEGSFSDFLSAI